MAHNTIYEKLTADPDDLVGAFAYIIYKQQKVEFCKGAQRSAEELDRFHSIAGLDTSIAAYRAQGEAMAQAFLNASLDQLVERTEAETRQDTLYRFIATENASLQTKLQAVSDALEAKRTFLGWIRDVGGNLVVNFVTILAIGAAVLGYKFIGALQQGAEQGAGIGANTSQEVGQRPSAPAQPVPKP